MMIQNRPLARRVPNGYWAKLTGKLFWINDSIGELCALFQAEGMSFGKSRANGLMV
jgi:hypothetical protein